MGLEDLKVWHWVLIGLLVGGAVSYMWTSFAPDDIKGREISQEEFESKLVGVYPMTKEPYLRSLTVRPIQDGRLIESGTVREKIQIATGERLMSSRDGKSTAYLPFTYIATIPYKSNAYAVPRGTTLQDYLKQVAETHSDLKFRYGWWRVSWAATAIITTGSVVLIGGVWPMLINLMIGAGFARPPKPKETYDLSRFGKGRPDAEKQRKAGMTNKEYQKIAAMADQMERNLAAHAGPRGAAESVGSADRPVQTLSGGPLDASSIPKPVEDEIEVKQREFYPVIVHHEKKKPEDKK